MVIRVRGIVIDNRKRSITHAGKTWRHISNTRWRYTMCLILGGGLTAAEIFDRCYGDRADGGPLSGVEHSRTFVHHTQLKPRLIDLGLKYAITHDGGGHNRYEVIPEQDKRGCR